MKLKVYGRAYSSSIVDEDTGKTLAIFNGGEYPFSHGQMAHHYKTLMEAIKAPVVV